MRRPAPDGHPADGSVRGALALAILAVAGQSALHLLNAFALDHRFAALDAASDRGIAAAAAVLAGGSAAIAALALARRSGGRRDAILLAVLALVLGFLAVDRVAGLHDRLANRVAELLGLPHVAGWPTLIVFAPLLVPAALILWSGVAGPSSRHAARAGIALLGVALVLRAVALVVKLTFGHIPGGSAHELAVVAKQGLELGGWVVLAVALVTTAMRADAEPARAPSLRADARPS